MLRVSDIEAVFGVLGSATVVGDERSGGVVAMRCTTAAGQATRMSEDGEKDGQW